MRNLPGLPATWASARKQAVGTALSERSRVWFSVADGVLSEVYYPTIDCPSQRDLQLLITDGGQPAVLPGHPAQPLCRDRGTAG